MNHTLILPIALLSKNARDKITPRQRSAIRLSYEQIISLKYPRRFATPQHRQLVTVIRIMGPRERPFDLQNIGAGSSIELLDSFTRLGWWFDDSERWLKPTFEQTRSEKERGPAVCVEIAPL